MMIKINEIFYSLQGEGKWTGLPNIFIRTSGCNLRCSYCDTQYAYKTGKELTTDEILKKIRKYECKKICLTGGEPLLQKEKVLELIDTFLEKKYKVLLETNGSIDISKFTKKKDLIVSMDIKCPSSEMHKKMNLENIKFLEKKDQLKFVIKNKEDYDYAKNLIQKYSPDCDIFFQPVWGEKPEKLAEWILEDNTAVKLGLQIHKIINLK